MAGARPPSGDGANGRDGGDIGGTIMGRDAGGRDAGGRDADGGRIVLAATPLGNVADASPRLLALLAAADVIAAEDTRRLRRLAADLGVDIRGQVIAYHDHNEAERAAELLERAQHGDTVVVVTDAGMPAVSDPGFRLTAAAVEAGVPVTVAPGASAVTAALAVSGLPSDRFCFEGFPPRKPGRLAAYLDSLRAEPRTMVFFESPRRVHATLTAMADAFGADRPAVLCRELTKTYEEILRGSLGSLAAATTAGVLGEVTLVVAGWSAGEDRTAPTPADLASQVATAEAAGLSRKEAIAEVAQATGIPKREIFDALVAHKRQP